LAAQQALYHRARCNQAPAAAIRRAMERDDRKQHNHEGNNGDSGEPEPGPYWKRMHRDWRFWIGALLMGAALAVYVLSGDLAWFHADTRNRRCPHPDRDSSARSTQ